MILVELIYNLALLVALSVVSGFLDTRWKRSTRAGVLLQGLLFGGAAMIAMLRPFVFAPGLVFDGRSVMISLCGLFFGPWAVLVTGAMTIPLRLAQGGPGALMGVMVILCSMAIGAGFHVRLRHKLGEIPAGTLFLFGLLVHLAMLAMALALPVERILPVLKTIGVPVMLAYPLATVLIGKILSDQEARGRFLDSLQESEERYRELVERAHSVIVRIRPDGTITFFNEFAQRFFGYAAEEVLGRNVVGTIVPEKDSAGRDLAAIVREVLAHPDRYVAYENENMRKDGTRCWLAWSNQDILDEQGRCVAILCVGTDITERRRMEAALRDSELKHSKMVANIGDVIVIVDQDGRFRYHSPNVGKWFGWRPEELAGTSILLNIHPEDQSAMRRFHAGILSRPNVIDSMESRIQCKDGSYKWIRITAVNLIADPDICGILGSFHDITEHKRAEAEKAALEARLQQAQKMEAVGRLAGGVAHDFNNMLQTILGNVELALEEVPPGNPLRESIEEIRKSAQRSAELIRQLLAFARKQTIAPKVLDLNETVEGMLKFLRRLIGENVRLEWLPGAGAGTVTMDPTQLDQILANLCVNARDAIAGVGRITIETAGVTLDGAVCAPPPDFLPGEYVRVIVSDDGKGMEAETLAHIFEPFFTTKKLGEGTGLGLATVYGIVRQNHGFIDVRSQPGKGTTFTIYLPRSTGRTERAPALSASAPLVKSAGETVLLVEDDPSILGIACRALQRLGYNVLAANTPSEAMRLAQAHAGQIQLLMTDVVMPEMNGRDLAARLVAEQPDLKCLFMSGYAANVIAPHGILESEVHFIQKPFTIADLAAKVREALKPPRP